MFEHFPGNFPKSISIQVRQRSGGKRFFYQLPNDILGTKGDDCLEEPVSLDNFGTKSRGSASRYRGKSLVLRIGAEQLANKCRLASSKSAEKEYTSVPFGRSGQADCVITHGPVILRLRFNISVEGGYDTFV